MSATRTLTPTPRGAKILALVDRDHEGSIGKAARAAGFTEALLRRWIYQNPDRLSRSTAAGFAKIGVSRSVLLDD